MSVHYYVVILLWLNQNKIWVWVWVMGLRNKIMDYEKIIINVTKYSFFAINWKNAESKPSNGDSTIDAYGASMDVSAMK
jgi:hypothetical protein